MKPTPINAKVRDDEDLAEVRENLWRVVHGDVKDSDRIRALELIAKLAGGFVERVEHSGTLTLGELVEEARRLYAARKGA